MATANLFKSNDIVESKTIEELLADIIKPAWTGSFTTLRGFQKEGKVDQGEWILQQINKFSVGDGLILIEFNDIPEDQLQNIKDAVSGSEFTYACFLNVTATGIIVLVNLGEGSVNEILKPVVEYYEKLTGLKIDTTSISGNCYMSYDSGLYLNEGCKVFKECKVANTVSTENPMLDLIADIVPMKIVMPSTDIVPTAENLLATVVEEEEDLIPETNGSTLIPESVYENLPDLLKQACSVFKDPVERDIFLTGSICVLSGCFDMFAGKYDQRTVYCNLFCFPYARAGSGKGVLYYSKKLGMAIHEKLRADITGGTKLLFIPANISASSMIARLNNNDEKGIILETEADTLNYTLKKQWGNMSDILRKSFHHEPVTISRISSNQLDELDFPRLSIILSGTPDQVKRLIPSAEDGLFSRFMFYCCEGITTWKDLSPDDDVDFETHFDKLSKKVLEMHEFYNQYAKGFHYTREQWAKHSVIFKKVHTELTQFINRDLNATVKRIGLIQYRIAMILTAIRIAGLNPTEEKVYCSDGDFETATQMALTYLEHAKTLFQFLPAALKTNIEPGKKQLYDTLPSTEFGRKDAIAIVKRLGFSMKTGDNYLKELLDGKLLGRTGFGKYKKV